MHANNLDICLGCPTARNCHILSQPKSDSHYKKAAPETYCLAVWYFILKLSSPYSGSAQCDNVPSYVQASTVLHPQALSLQGQLISQVLLCFWKLWYDETAYSSVTPVQLTCTETTQESGRYNVMTLTIILESLPTSRYCTVCHVQIKFSSRWHTHTLSLLQKLVSHVSDLLTLHQFNQHWSSVNIQLYAHFTHTLLNYVRAKHGLEQRVLSRIVTTLKGAVSAKCVIISKSIQYSEVHVF